MGQYDVHRLRDGGQFVVDCQSDLLSSLKTRLVVPLLAESAFNPEGNRLNPMFVLSGQRFFFVPQGAMSLLARELGPVVGSLGHDAEIILAAIDLLLTGV